MEEVPSSDEGSSLESGMDEAAPEAVLLRERE